MIALTWFFGTLAWFVIGAIGVFLVAETHERPLPIYEAISGLLLGPVALILAILIFATEGLKQ